LGNELFNAVVFAVYNCAQKNRAVAGAVCGFPARIYPLNPLNERPELAPRKSIKG
jgi:hypothetical protein